ncbi:hypothetical protein FCV25MIE_31757 [Fagus crenata]
MPSRPRPLHLFQIIPNINMLDDFGEQDPPAISGLTSPTKPVTEGVTFKFFLDHYVDRSTIFETSLSNDEVIGFSTAGKKLFRNLADILITFSRKESYAGDFMGRIRMYQDWNVSYPYPAQVPEKTSKTSFSDGLQADVKHFRRMIESLNESDLDEVLNYDPDYYLTITGKGGKTGDGHTLVDFVRNLYHHFREKAIDSNSDEKIKKLFPDLSAIIVDAAIRGCNDRWFTSDRNEKLAYYLFRKPFGFEEPNYRLEEFVCVD